jgi:hypothetical protein
MVQQDQGELLGDAGGYRVVSKESRSCSAITEADDDKNHLQYGSSGRVRA